MPSGTHRRLTLALTAITCLAALTTEPAHAIVTYRKVALSNEQAVGLAPGTNYGRFQSPAINAAGSIVFANGHSFLSATGIWLDNGNGPTIVAHSGGEVPGAEDGHTFNVFPGLPAVNDLGQVAFFATTNGPNAGQGIWSGEINALNLVASTNNHVPGMGSDISFSKLVFDPDAPISFNNHGDVAFFAEISGDTVDTTNNEIVWVGGPESPGFIIREGNPAAGMGPGVRIGSLASSYFPPSLNDSGQIAFKSLLLGDGVDFTNNVAIWLGNNSDIYAIARTGGHAPGLEPDGIFYQFPSPSPTEYVETIPKLNGSGQVVFWATAKYPDDPHGYRKTGIWNTKNDELTLAALSGQPIPGSELDVSISTVYQTIIGADGSILIDTRYYENGVSYDSMWLTNNDTAREIVRSDDPAPGAPQGAVFNSINGIAMNELGDVLFRASLRNAGLQNEGLWVSRATGEIVKLVVRGEQIDVNNDPLIEEFRTVGSIAAIAESGGQDGYARSINNAGQVALNVEFTDGTSGIFVATLGIPGDLDGDGFVGITDLNLILANWNQSVPPGDALADANGDNFVGIADLNAVLGNWNAGTPPTDQTNIPEPATAMICLTGLILANRRAG